MRTLHNHHDTHHARIRAGFTLIELLVVISIIGLLATVISVAVQNARAKARDTLRVANMEQVKKAMQLFFDANGRYPDTANDGISGSGEVVGDGGTFETALAPYLPQAPGDPSYDGTTGVNEFFFGYDPTHNGCQPVLSINRFETTGALNEYGRRDTSSGADMYINTADYNYCPSLYN